MQRSIFRRLSEVLLLEEALHSRLITHPVETKDAAAVTRAEEVTGTLAREIIEGTVLLPVTVSF